MNILSVWRVGLVALVATAFFVHAQTTNFTPRFAAVISAKDQKPDAERLQELLKAHWEYSMVEFPENATWYGYPGQNHRWTDYSLEAIARRKEDLKQHHAAILSIDRAKLSEADQLNYDLFRRNIEGELEGTQFPAELMPLTQLSGVQQEVAQMIAMMPTQNVKHYEDMLARIRGTKTLVEQNLALLKRGVEQGIVPPRVPLRELPTQVKNQIFDDPWKSPILRPFAEMPTSIEKAQQERLKAAAAAAYQESVKPAYQALYEYLEKTYLPACRESIGLYSLPNGTNWYAYNARISTTTSLTPQQIHNVGLAEVKRIRAEMEQIMRDTGFNGTLVEFFAFLRTDKRFYYDTGNELLAGYREISKRVDPELIRLFGRLPRQPYGVLPIPSYAEKSQTTAYYQPGSSIAGRPGYFYANTYNLSTRPKWEMEALTLHEAVPGHHLQLALADELEGVPDFRKYGRYTAFVEGWGLYSESLGTEMGFYKDPYSKFGQLTYEMWRAIRLVVDTGMHALGWSREQAINFFKENAGKTEHDITVEIDRYIVWPGQALAYKIGELKIKELRALATKELGDKFDVRGFHDTLLGAGPLPLEVLEQRMKDWIKAQKSVR